MKFRNWVFAFFALGGLLVGEQNPLLQSIKNQKPIILKHGDHDTTEMVEQLRDSVRRGTSFEIDGNIIELDGISYFVNAHCPDCYVQERILFPRRDHPEELNPALLMPVIRKTGVFLKCDFKSGRCIDTFGYLAQMVPPHQKVGHAFVAELVVPGTKMPECCVDELLTFEQVERARKLLGKGTPFIVSCNGVTYENLSPQLVDSLAEKAVGKAEFFNLNLPEHSNPPVRYAEQLWTNHGLVPEVRIHSKEDKDYWDSQPFPYLGLTDDPDLATVLN